MTEDRETTLLAIGQEITLALEELGVLIDQMRAILRPGPEPIASRQATPLQFVHDEYAPADIPADLIADVIGGRKP